MLPCRPARITLRCVLDPDERIVISMRMRRSGVGALDHEAAAEGVNRTEIIRTLLAEALAARRERAKTAPERAQNA
jgi:putative ubiquitin-RnfH superfamily antitoxin RatB of RatAB toxin-antitoxin module